MASFEQKRSVTTFDTNIARKSLNKSCQQERGKVKTAFDHKKKNEKCPAKYYFFSILTSAFL